MGSEGMSSVVIDGEDLKSRLRRSSTRHGKRKKSKIRKTIERRMRAEQCRKTTNCGQGREKESEREQIGSQGSCMKEREKIK